MKKEKIEKILAPFEGLFVMLETFAKMLIAVITLYIVVTRGDITLSTFQIFCINIAMVYWVCKPTLKFLTEMFFT